MHQARRQQQQSSSSQQLGLQVAAAAAKPANAAGVAVLLGQVCAEEVQQLFQGHVLQ
jgi:hypothetical protein